jgi:hypothetical protein
MLRRLSEGLAGAFNNRVGSVLVVRSGVEGWGGVGGEDRREAQQRAGREAVDADQIARRWLQSPAGHRWGIGARGASEMGWVKRGKGSGRERGR